MRSLRPRPQGSPSQGESPDRPLARVTVRTDVRDPDAWYWRLPAVAQRREEGLVLAPVTVLVGQNGSGKSTVVEAVAHAWRESLTAHVKHWGPDPSAEDTDLWRELEFSGAHPRPQGGIWLRGEAMHQVFAGLDAAAIELRAFDGIPLNRRSHGEAFLALLESRTTERGLWVLDEPESALSFRSSLRLLALLHGIPAARGLAGPAGHAFPRPGGDPRCHGLRARRRRLHRPGVDRPGPRAGLGGVLRRPAPPAAPPARRLRRSMARARMHDDEVDVDAALVARLLADQFPQ